MLHANSEGHGPRATGHHLHDTQGQVNILVFMGSTTFSILCEKKAWEQISCTWCLKKNSDARGKFEAQSPASMPWSSHGGRPHSYSPDSRFCSTSFSVGRQSLVGQLFFLYLPRISVVSDHNLFAQHWISGFPKLLPSPKLTEYMPTRNSMCFSSSPPQSDSSPCLKALLIVFNIVVAQHQTLKGQSFRFSSLPLWLTNSLLVENCPKANPSSLLLLRRSLLGRLVCRP